MCVFMWRSCTFDENSGDHEAKAGQEISGVGRVKVSRPPYNNQAFVVQFYPNQIS